MATFTSFKGVTEIGRSLLSDQLETNVLSFFKWGFLGVGGFFNVTIPKTGPYGGNQHRLRLAEDSNYTKGQVYEGFRKDWVWESGVEYHYQPIQHSGIFVNGGFQPSTGTGIYKYHVDYPNGRIVFDNPIAASSVVTCEFSYRYAHITTADAPWWRRIQTDSMRVDSADFLQYGSGQYSTQAQNRVQLPAVVVEAVPRTSRVGKEIGGLMAIVKQDVLFHIIGENRWDVKQIHDIIVSQWQKRLQAFDKNAMLSANSFPLDADGSRVSGAKMYPDLVKGSGEGGFYWNQFRIVDMKSSDSSIKFTAPINYATVRGTFEIDLA